MGILDSWLKRRPTTTKEKDAGLTASTIDYVLNELGTRTLVRGSIVLDSQLKPSFSTGTPDRRNDIVSIVPIGNLEEAEFFREFEDMDVPDWTKFMPVVDNLVYAILRRWEIECPAYAALPSA